MIVFRRLIYWLGISGALLWLAIRPTLAQEEPIPCEAVYTVQAGDWLSKIAEKYYDNLLTYPAIAFATNQQKDNEFAFVTDYDLIEPAWQLCIPPPETAVEILAKLPTPTPASQHANLPTSTPGIPY